MLQRALAICAVLGFVTAAHAGLAISLIPQTPGPYNPGQTVNVDVLAQLTPGTPSVPGPVGTTTTVRVRLLQFDVSDTSPELSLGVVGHHPLNETFDPDADGVFDPIPFWDFSGASACAGNEAACGDTYFIDGSISDNILNTTYIGTSSSGTKMIVLTQANPKRVGELAITMPNEGGTFSLDVLNADETDINKGAQLNWGFGLTSDPTDPASPLRANGGGITMVVSSLTDPQGRLQFAVVPEPATLALLGLGGLAAAFRRRNA